VSPSTSAPNNLALASLLCGIFGIVLSFLLGCIIPGASMLGLALSVVAIITGFMGHSQAAVTGTGGGMAIAGAATGCLNLLLWGALFGFTLLTVGLVGLLAVLTNA
jgi:hypothetical protein